MLIRTSFRNKLQKLNVKTIVVCANSGQSIIWITISVCKKMSIKMLLLKV